MLPCSCKLSEVDGEEGAVNEAVDKVVDEFAEDECRAVGLAEESVDGGKDVLCTGSPDIKVLPNFGKI